MRTLPLRLAPVDGESLPGYVARYSNTFQFQPGDVVRALGLDAGGGTVIAAGRYGALLSADQLKHAALGTGIAPEVLELMLLARYSGRAFERVGVSPDAVLDEAAQGHEVLIRSSRFCPKCLHENGAWLLRWQLGWSAVCPRHNVLLLRVCANCGNVPKTAPRESWPHDHHGALSDPARCSHRRGRQICRARLANAQTPEVNSEILTAQQRIDRLIDGGPRPILAGEELEPPIYLRGLHALCKLLAYPTRLAAPADSPRRSAGWRLFDDPAALGTVLPRALDLADLPDWAALTDAIRDLADRRYLANGQTLPVSKLGELPKPLRQALRHAVSETVWAPAMSQIGLHPRTYRRPADLDPRLQARHVPQLFWAEDYAHGISRLFDFDDFTHWLGRRFCSVLLARMLTPLDWHGAVRYLDFPERFINEGYNTTLAKLRSNDRFDELVSRVKRIANQHAEHELIDYKQRRAELTDWTGIDVDAWHLLQPRSRPLYPHRRVDMPVRRAHASIWLWCQLTSGDERASPFELPTARGLFDQTHFIRHLLPAYRDRLLILEELLLNTPAEARSTLHNRLAGALHKRGHIAENFHVNTIDPLIVGRVLAHTAAHTGVDIPTITKPSECSHAPPAVTHARLLAAGLLRRTALASWAAIAVAIGGDANHIGDNNWSYQAALEWHPGFAAQFERLAHAVENWRKPAPAPPTTPHHDRMRHVANAINTRAADLLAQSHGPDVARRTSIAVCREHTDLTCYDIAAIHNVADAQPAFASATVIKHQAIDQDFDRRYQQLKDHARQARHDAGFANANLKRGLTSKPRSRPRPDQGFNYVSHRQVR